MRASGQTDRQAAKRMWCKSFCLIKEGTPLSAEWAAFTWWKQRMKFISRAVNLSGWRNKKVTDNLPLRSQFPFEHFLSLAVTSHFDRSAIAIELILALGCVFRNSIVYQCLAGVASIVSEMCLPGVWSLGGK